MGKDNPHIRREFIAALCLVMLVLAVFGQTLNFDFIYFDDNDYVFENPVVCQGLTMEGTRWALTTRHAANWHPLTWISHMLDVELFGLHPGAHHLVGLGFHILNSLLLFLLFRRMTGTFWKSLLVAAIFVVHPLHVESVAWIAERKDVLSTCMGLLALLAYTRYADHPSIKGYLAVAFLFALGLMAKPMLVTLPAVMLLLDFWPLGRFFPDSPVRKKRPFFHLFLEKIPLLFLSGLSSGITLAAQKSGGALAGTELYPLSVRIANSLVSYAGYLRQAVWPADLAVFYPHPGMPGTGQFAGASLLIISISLLAVCVARRLPWILVGWLWYLGTLVPVIGLVQVGAQAMADRYTYFPLVGIFVIAVWGMDRLAPARPAGRVLIYFCTAGYLVILGTMSWIQTGYWQSTETLFVRATAVIGENALTHNKLGLATLKKGEPRAAERHFSAALALEPGNPEHHSNLGISLACQGRDHEAARHYRNALALDSGLKKTHNNLGNILDKQGHYTAAVRHYRAALRIDPEYAVAHNNLGVALLRAGKTVDAVKSFKQALRIHPTYASARKNLEKITKQQLEKGEQRIND